MLAGADCADIAVGYLFVSGFNAVAEELGRLEKVRILVGRLDRHTLEEVALGVQQAEALQACPDGDRPARRDVEALADPTTPSQLVQSPPRADRAPLPRRPRTAAAEPDPRGPSRSRSSVAGASARAPAPRRISRRFLRPRTRSVLTAAPPGHSTPRISAPGPPAPPTDIGPFLTLMRRNQQVLRTMIAFAALLEPAQDRLGPRASSP
jgi:hypothetical protein